MEEKDKLGFQGKAFPRWLSILWMLFFLWAIVYSIFYTFPDLLQWLKGSVVR